MAVVSVYGRPGPVPGGGLSHCRLGRIHPANDMLTHELVGKFSLGIDLDDPQRWG